MPVLVWVTAWLSAGSAGAQASPGDTVYHLRGRVVNGLTGKSLSRALVISVDRRLATMTDAAGRFDLTVSVPSAAASAANGSGRPNGFVNGTNMSRGNFGGSALMLTTKKPGYLDPDQATDLPLDATLSESEVTLSLMPAGSVDGSISATETDTARDVRVILLQQQVQDGSYTWVQVGTDTTDSHGDFHFGGLRPGEYTVMTAAWRGERPITQPRLTVTRQYPPMFLGDATGLGTAAKLQVHTGEFARADLHLQLTSYYPVTIPVQASTEGNGVQVQFAGEPFSPGFNLTFSARDGAVRGSLPTGTYMLLLSSSGPQPSFASVPLHVGSAAVQTAAVTLAPVARIPVHVHEELTGKGSDFPLSVNLLMRPAGGIGAFSNGNLSPSSGDEFYVENARPGSYRVEAHAGGGYVAVLRSGGVDLLREPLTVQAGGGAEPIEVTVRYDGAQIKGKVTVAAGNLPPNSFVLLLPIDGSGAFHQGFAGPDGTFTIGNVPPGNYHAFAVRENRVQLPYREPEAMHAYDGKGVSITVTASGQVQADVPLLDVVNGQVR